MRRLSSKDPSGSGGRGPRPLSCAPDRRPHGSFGLLITEWLALCAVVLLASRSHAQCGVEREVGAATDGLDRFGAALHLDGDELFVGAPGADVAPGGLEGSVYLFRRQGAAWLESKTLVSPNAQTLDEFGFALARSGDLLAVGVPGGDGVVSGSGSVVLFEKSGTDFVLAGELFASDGMDGDRFGESIAFDGTRLIVGAPDRTEFAARDGAAYVFTDSGSGLSQTGKLVNFAPEVGARFGAALAADGGQLLVGAPASTFQGIPFAGLVGRFVATPGSYAFTTLVDSPVLGIGAFFGAALAVEDSVALIGAPGFNQFVGVAAGSAWSLDLSSPATQPVQLVLEDAAAGDETGSAVLLDLPFAYLSRPDRIAFGQPTSGSVDRFEQVAGGFAYRARLDPWSSLLRPGFGRAIAAQGDTLIAGAPDESPIPGFADFQTGAFYAHDLSVALGSLTVCPPSLSALTGGTADLRVRSGSPSAFLLTLVSASGVTPGTPLDAQVLPLAADDLTLAVLTGALPLLEDAFALAGGLGEQRPRFTLTPTLATGLSGSSLTFATVVWDAMSFAVVTPAGPAELLITP